MTMERKLAPSRELASRLVHAAMTILSNHDQEMPAHDLFAKVEKAVKLDDWARERYEKSGYIRWESILHFYSIDCVKAGFLVKKNGTWYLTPEGKEALKLAPQKLLEKAGAAYDQWRQENPKIREEEPEGDVPSPTASYDDIEQKAIEGLQRYINAKNPYEFQDLVAALLRGMGYYTPFVAPRGKDGGTDIVAYRDPLGTQSPRIQVQIKHRQSTATVAEIRELMGLLHKEGDVGIFVSTGGFTPDGKATARSSHVHVELIDLNRFIGLWEEFYDKLNEEDRSLLPLRPINFLAPTE